MNELGNTRDLPAALVCIVEMALDLGDDFAVTVRPSDSGHRLAVLEYRTGNRESLTTWSKESGTWKRIELRMRDDGGSWCHLDIDGEASC